jgi:gamma-glutamyltranspeptidase
MPTEQRPASYLSSFGRVQIVVIDDGRFTAAADPRNDGGIPFYA